MKLKHIIAALLIAAIAGATTAFTLHQNIRWEWKGRPFVEFKNGGDTIQFGLADDGTVVWRELIPIRTNLIVLETNSPAEKPISYEPTIQFGPGVTNLNWIFLP